ncbi:hypothetical protein BDV26DRAFT_295587 [Aspergillus bertholletiae]|uniref:Stress-response A/B barrel domain-containing protein n=1 Tax=Aspergillus bertholletiae TaxID=1226010 RepID=A0A5N7AZQ7_9EURO|nr:hypothetical protein BDV26DRAFT_295587 [Aspergillus bertholletiae]
MAILHIVLFRFKPDIGLTTQHEMLRESLSLSKNCADASQKPYIKSLRVGLQCDPGLPTDYTHVLVVEFNSVQDREYYKVVDPVHLDFASRIMPMLDLVTMSVFNECNFQEP